MIHTIEELSAQPMRMSALDSINTINLSTYIQRIVKEAQDMLILRSDPKLRPEYNSRLYEIVYSRLRDQPYLIKMARGSLNYVLRKERAPKHKRVHEVRATFSNGKPSHLVASRKGLSWRKAKRWAADVKEASLVIDFTLNPKRVPHTMKIIVSHTVLNQYTRPAKK